MRPGEYDRAVEEWGERDEIAGERFGERLGIAERGEMIRPEVMIFSVFEAIKAFFPFMNHSPC